MFDVIYDTSKKQRVLKKEILRVYKYFNITDHKNIQTEISLMLHENQYTFKHKCFASERECRIMYKRPISKTYNEISKIEYSNQNGIIAPYIDIAIPNKNNLISEFYISPFIKDPRAEVCLKNFLMQRNVFNSSTKIIKSELPVEF